jgi:hypothetical protein
MKPEALIPPRAANLNAAPATTKIDIHAMAARLAGACLAATGPREASS